MSIGLNEHENIHHEPLSDLEKAEAIKKLIEIREWNELTAAVNLGMGYTTIQYLLSLVDAPKEVMKIKGWSELAAAANLVSG